MITKFISSAMAIVTLDVYLQSQLHSNDLLFLFASNSLLINSLMMMLAGLAVTVSFKKRFDSWYRYAACSAGALILCLTGFAGSFFSNIDYRFSSVLLPLDYLLILQAGIIFGICALSYKHAEMPVSVKQYRPVVLINKLAVKIPKISHSPAPARGGRISHA